MTQHIVINKCFGGFGLSPKAVLWLYERGCKSLDVTPVDKYYDPNPKGYAATKEYQDHMGKDAQLSRWRSFIKGDPEADGIFLTIFSPDEKFVIGSRPDKRDDPLLVQCVRELGKEANGEYADLKVVEVPDGVEWEISEYDGNEHIAQVHQTWG